MRLKSLIRSAVLNTWFSNGAILLNGLIAIPIVVTKLTIEEINVWFLFSSVVTISQAVLFGFSGTFTRFISYSYGGVKISEFLTIKRKLAVNFSTNFDSIELGRILSLQLRIYLILSLIQMVSLFLGGYFALRGPINQMETPYLGWVAWLVIVLSATINLALGSFRVFLEGIDRVDLTQRILGLSNLFGLILILIVLVAYPSLLSIVVVYQFISLSASIVTAYYYKRTFTKLGLSILDNGFDKALFVVVWDSAWKSGITVVIAAVVKNISSILVAQLFSPQAAGPFLLTKRVFDILERFTSATFRSKIPVISKLRGRGDLSKLIPTLLNIQYLSFGVFILGYLCLIILGNTLLEFIGSNVTLGSAELIILFSFSSFLSRWTGFGLTISNQSNNVIEHLNAALVFSVFFIVFFSGYQFFDILVFPVSQIVALISTVPLLINQVYKGIGTTFVQYEKKLLLPLLSGLILINVFYYILYS